MLMVLGRRGEGEQGKQGKPGEGNGTLIVQYLLDEIVASASLRTLHDFPGGAW